MKGTKLIICPKCGYSFKITTEEALKGKLRCPMCGHEFGRPSINPEKPDDFKKERY
jgi:uncharacterized Zn finger protein (UPF0148 family)